MKKRFLGILLAALLVCGLCFAISSCNIVFVDDDTETPCEHEWEESGMITPPSCSERGTVSLKCKKFNETREKTVVPDKDAHAFGAWVEEVAATCINGTIGHYRCSLCDRYFDIDKNRISNIIAVAREPHDFVDGICTKCGNEIVYATDLEYTLSDDGTYYTVTGIGSCKENNIYIPEKYNGLPVKAIGDYAFAYCSSVTSITIPDGVTYIGKESFSYCSITSIQLPDSLTTIGMRAFLCCSIKSLTVPASVTSMGVGAFVYCPSLEDATVYSSLSEYAFDGCVELESVTLGDSVAYISNNAFYKCAALKSITIPDSVSFIGASAFDGCTSLASVTIGNRVSSIGDSAFSGCRELKSIVIPDRVTRIGWYLFSGCSKLESVTIGNRVNAIGCYAFDGCKNLTGITFKDNTTWYTTKNSDDWKKKTNGTETALASDAENATLFTSDYKDYYWYKR